jgi:hypothetical protein
VFTNEEYANMHFVFSFCSGNGRAAVALLPTLQNFKSQNIRDCTQNFEGQWFFPQVNAVREQQWCAEGALLLPGDHTNHV